MQAFVSIGKIFPIVWHLFSAVRHSAEGRLAKSAAAQVEVTSRRILVDVLICVVATIVSLAPFANKAFHTDDTFFLYIARQVCTNPLDPFGFKLHWFGTEIHAADAPLSGPLTSYYIALAASYVGWSEIALHVAFLVPAVAAVLGTYFLAVHFCTKPMVATLATLLSPVFLVSSATLMCDTMMLAFSVWAVVLWLWSEEKGSHVLAIFSGCLIAAASLTKCVAAVSLVPLLLAYSLLRWPRVRWRFLYLLIPVVIFLAYDQTMRRLYDHSLLYGAGSAALVGGRTSSCMSRGIATLSFMGGCLATAIFYAPLLWSRRALAMGFLGIGLVVGLLYCASRLGDYDLPAGNGARLLIALQFGVFFVAGISLLALAITDLWHAWSAASALLVLWLAGTFLFCWLINWTVNGRTILPMAPAASILIVRRIGRYGGVAGGRSSPCGVNAPSYPVQFLPLVPVAVVAVAVTWADVCWADTERAAAATMNDHYRGRKDAVLFAGNSGFQYYMESHGFKAVDVDRTRLMPGEVLILPWHNVNVPLIPAELFSKTRTFEFASFPYLSTSWPEVGANFYEFASWGLLPFGVGAVGTERYDVVTARASYELNPLIRQWQQELTKHPDSAEALGNLGNTLASADRTLEAKEYLERAVRLGSKDAVTLNNLAWLLATCPVDGKRNGAAAVRHAQRARKLLGDVPVVLDTLAAAYAEAGRFPESLAAARKALELVTQQNDRALIQDIRSRISLYEAGKPYRQPLPK